MNKLSERITLSVWNTMTAISKYKGFSSRQQPSAGFQAVSREEPHPATHVPTHRNVQWHMSCSQLNTCWQRHTSCSQLNTCWQWYTSCYTSVEMSTLFHTSRKNVACAMTRQIIQTMSTKYCHVYIQLYLQLVNVTHRWHNSTCHWPW